MTALGVPTSSSPSTATCASSPLDQYLSRSSPRTVEEEGGGVGTGKMKVTTYFIGTLLDPSVPFALFSQYPPSPFSSTAPSKRDAITRARDEENWNRLGPFVGMGKEEMYEGLRDVTWCQKQCEGWMLMRWKEIDFVNVERESDARSLSPPLSLTHTRLRSFNILDLVYIKLMSISMISAICCCSNSCRIDSINRRVLLHGIK